MKKKPQNKFPDMWGVNKKSFTKRKSIVPLKIKPMKPIGVYPVRKKSKGIRPIVPLKKNIWIHDRHDTDRDGVPNFRDCQPFNPRKQGILHPGKERCWGCRKWFPKEEMEFIKGYIDAFYCKECAVTEKQYQKEKRERERELEKESEAWERDVDKAESRCPYCGFKDFVFFRKDEWNSPDDDIYICPKCHKTFRIFEQFNWDLRKMGHKTGDSIEEMESDMWEEPPPRKRRK